MNIIEMQSPARIHFAIGRQFVSNQKAQQLANSFGGTPYDYKKPDIIWQARVNIQLSAKDFKILGSKAALNANYANPIRPENSKR